jgi:mannosyltransferase
VLGLITGGYHVGVPPIWGDEGVTKVMAARSVGQILATMPHDDVVHGLYYLVVHVVERVAGSSPADLRFPSVVAMAVAAACTALLAHRLAVLVSSPHPALTGLAAGSLFALFPGTIYYAQEARSYAIVTMLATIATYLLLRAASDGGRWWAGYWIAAALTGLCNIFGLFLLGAHAVSLLIAGRRLPGPPGRRILGVQRAWLIAAVAAVVAASPVIAFAFTQRGALAWMTAPPSVIGASKNLAQFWAGSADLTWAVFGLAAFGVVAGVVAHVAGSGRQRCLSPVVVALPWLVLPPELLLVISQVHPLYDSRYVEFCLPALAVLAAWGLTWVARLAAVPPLRRARLGWLGWLPAVAILALVVAMLLPAGARQRLPSSRADNLAGDSRIVGALARPGDAVFFIPITYRPIIAAYPDDWRDVRDIALAKSPVASDTLYGFDVSPAELRKRFSRVSRVWVFTSPGESAYLSSPRATPVDKLQASLVARMRLVRSWRDGDKMLYLYEARH